MAALPPFHQPRALSPAETNALAYFTQTGNISLSAREAGIERYKLDALLKREEVKAALSEFRAAVRFNLGSKLYAITASAADRALEVLNKGEERIDAKTGERYRQEPCLRDLTYTASTFSKLFDDNAQAIQTEQLNERLLTLADRLAALGTGDGQAARTESRPGGANNKEEKVVARSVSDCNEFSKLDLLLNGGAEHG